MTAMNQQKSLADKARAETYAKFFNSIVHMDGFKVQDKINTFTNLQKALLQALSYLYPNFVNPKKST